MPNVNIYIPEKYVQPIRERLKEGESLGVCAKRLLLNFLDGRDIDSTNDGNAFDATELEDIKQRLSLLEQSFQDFLQGFNEVEDTLNNIQPQIDFTKTRITKLENELKQTPAPGRSRSKAKPVQDAPDYSVTPF
jgi:DNA repair ATPase RecN